MCFSFWKVIKRGFKVSKGLNIPIIPAHKRPSKSCKIARVTEEDRGKNQAETQEVWVQLSGEHVTILRRELGPIPSTTK